MLPKQSSYIVYAYIAPASLLIGPGSIGNVWMTSTPAQTFAEYEMWYDQGGVFALTMPAPPMYYMGLVKQYFQGMVTWENMLQRAGACIEIWAGSNHAQQGIDVYHRIVLRDNPTPNIYFRFIVVGVGTDPKNWWYGSDFRGVSYCDTGGQVLIRHQRL